jgi:hypothetical protein
MKSSSCVRVSLLQQSRLDGAAPDACGIWVTPDPCCCLLLRPPQIVKPEHRRELLSHSLLKSYQTQASAQGAGGELTVGLLVPHVSRARAAGVGWLTGLGVRHLSLCGEGGTPSTAACSWAVTVASTRLADCCAAALTVSMRVPACL